MQDYDVHCMFVVQFRVQRECGVCSRTRCRHQFYRQEWKQVIMYMYNVHSTFFVYVYNCVMYSVRILHYTFISIVSASLLLWTYMYHFLLSRPLHLAAQLTDQPDVVEVLLERGADPNTTHSSGATPLMTACQSNNIFSASMLLSRGAYTPL